MALTFPFKDPDEVLDYIVDWSSRLDSGDTILTSTWTITDSQGESPDLLLIDSDVVLSPPDSTLVWLSVGTEGVTYSLNNRITTAGLRTMDQTVKLKIKTK